MIDLKEHYFLEVDTKILNNFISNNIFECPNQNELFMSIMYDFNNEYKEYLLKVISAILNENIRCIHYDDLWYWVCNSSEILIFKAKNKYKSLEKYNKFHQDIVSEYLIDFQYRDIDKNFQNLGFRSVSKQALKEINMQNLVNIYKKDLPRKQCFEPKQLIILFEIEEKLVCIKLNYSNYLYNLVCNKLLPKPYAILKISDDNLIYDIAYKSKDNKSLLKKLMQKWCKREDVLDRMQDFFTYFCCLYKEELDSFLESYNK